MKKYILLGIDGVITSRRNSIMSMILERKPNLYGLDFFDMFCMVNLGSIPVETDADIIVSSSWRRLGKETLIRVWEHNGRCPRRLVGTTPVEIQAKRDAIETWISVHPDDRYVILDAEDLRLQNQVRTDPEVGLTLKNAREAIMILNKD